MALRRLGDLGQPQRHAPGQPRLRHERAALPLPPDAQGRSADVRFVGWAKAAQRPCPRGCLFGGEWWARALRALSPPYGLRTNDNEEQPHRRYQAGPRGNTPAARGLPRRERTLRLAEPSAP